MSSDQASGCFWRPKSQCWTVGRLGAVMGNEVAGRVHGAFSFTVGMEREDCCEWTDLETWKGSMTSFISAFDLDVVAEPGCSFSKISVKWLGAATGDEVAVRVYGALPLPMSDGFRKRGGGTVESLMALTLLWPIWLKCVFFPFFFLFRVFSPVKLLKISPYMGLFWCQSSRAV